LTTAPRPGSGWPSGGRNGSLRSSRRTGTPTRRGSATAGIPSAPTGGNPRRPTATRSAACSSPRRRCGNTPTESLNTHGVADPSAVSPDGYTLDNHYLARPGADEIQLDLFLDCASNVELYPAFQEYFRTRRAPLLAIWGRNDPFFLPAGAEAFKRDIPDADVHLLDTGHFALETHAGEIAAATRGFLTGLPARADQLAAA
jgi:pimeloyl-ACP methyl ester carboxylesterase